MIGLDFRHDCVSVPCLAYVIGFDVWNGSREHSDNLFINIKCLEPVGVLRGSTPKQWPRRWRFGGGTCGLLILTWFLLLRREK